MQITDLKPGQRLWCIRSYCGGSYPFWYKEGNIYTVKEVDDELVTFVEIPSGAFRYSSSKEYSDDWGVGQDFLLSPAPIKELS